MTKLDEISEQTVHTALKRMRDASAAASSPLCRLDVIEQRMELEGYPDTGMWRATALRKELIDLIQLLNPNPTESVEPGKVTAAPSTEDRQTRAYTILHQRYVLGHLAYNIANYLHISARLYHLEQRRAIRQIAQLLIEKELALRAGKSKIAFANNSASRLTHAYASHNSINSEPTTEPQVLFASAAMLDRPFLAPTLPAIHSVFGREDLVATIRLMLTRPERPKSIAFWGNPGVGKSAVMAQVFHDSALGDAFPDGAIYASLGSQADTNGVLLTWAIALGLSPAAYSETPARERIHLVKALIGSRRMMIGIDDVWSVYAARALDVAGPNCITFLATRSPLIAREYAGDHALNVPELSDAASASLLRAYVRDIDQIAPGATQTATRTSGGLPLTLSLIGRDWQRVRGLTSTPSLFGALSNSNRSRTDDILQNAILSSYKLLDRQAQLALMALSALPPKPHSISDEAMNAVAGDWRVTEQLVDMGLVLPEVSPSGEVTYSIHKSIRDFVAGLPMPTGLVESEARLIDYFIYQAETKRHLMSNHALQSLQAAIELARERNDRDRLQRGKMALPSAQFG